MHARVAIFEGGDADEVRRVVSDINDQAADGPPEGVPAIGFLMLHQADQGKVMAISLYESEEDLDKGDATLNSMDPPTPGALGRRSSVEKYEVGAKLDAPSQG